MSHTLVYGSFQQPDWGWCSVKDELHLAKAQLAYKRKHAVELEIGSLNDQIQKYERVRIEFNNKLEETKQKLIETENELQDLDNKLADMGGDEAEQGRRGFSG